MKEFFLVQFRFNQWANERLLDFIEQNNLKNDRINPVFSHLTLNQVLSCKRLNNYTTPVNINEWTSWPWAEIDAKNRETNEDLIDFVNAHNENFEEMVSFVNTSGTELLRSVRHILTHIMHHSSYHRGQIAIIIHEDNIIAPSTDFLDFGK